MSFLSSLFQCCQPKTPKINEILVDYPPEDNNKNTLDYRAKYPMERASDSSMLKITNIEGSDFEKSSLSTTKRDNLKPKIILSREGSATIVSAPIFNKDWSSSPEYIPTEEYERQKYDMKDSKVLILNDIVGTLLMNRQQEISYTGLKKKKRSGPLPVYRINSNQSVKAINYFWLKNTYSNINVLDFSKGKDFILNHCYEYLSCIADNYFFLICFIQSQNKYKIKFNDSVNEAGTQVTDNVFIKLSNSHPQYIISHLHLTIDTLQFHIKVVSKCIIEVIFLKNKRSYVFNALAQKEITIGKNENCTIPLPSSNLSDIHTTIYYDNESKYWKIRDGTENSSSLSGSWIFSTTPIEICDGMRIKLWKKEISISYE